MSARSRRVDGEHHSCNEDMSSIMESRIDVFTLATMSLLLAVHPDRVRIVDGNLEGR